ncbi:LOW QUALITY PROTEIN: hypothetical protein V2J09_001645 [Rumex salicifolius]
MLIAGDSKEEIGKLKAHLHASFQMKELGDLRYFLGIEDRKEFLSKSKKVCLGAFRGSWND